MKKRNMNEWFKGKGFYISLMAGAICVVAVAAVTLDSFGINKNMSGEKEKRDIAENILEKPEESGSEEIEEDITKYPVEIPTQIPQAKIAEEENANGNEIQNEVEEKREDKEKEQKKDKKEADKNKEESKEENKKVTVMNAGKDISSLKFNQEAGISWPVNGEILMKYSDSAVYHKTLGQYKSNPALLISAAEGENVSCAVDGIVTKVGENEEIGNYVETSIGDEYKIQYGGLDNVQVKKGDTIKKGEIIGVVAPPTKYYIEEGSNIYFKMTCKDEPVDPMIFLE